MARVVFTGRGNRINGTFQTRAQWTTLAHQFNHIVQDAVDLLTTYLVMADPNSNSSKARNARTLGVQCISYQDFERLCLAGQTPPAQNSARRTVVPNPTAQAALRSYRENRPSTRSQTYGYNNRAEFAPQTADPDPEEIANSLIFTTSRGFMVAGVQEVFLTRAAALMRARQTLHVMGVEGEGVPDESPVKPVATPGRRLVNLEDD